MGGNQQDTENGYEKEVNIGLIFMQGDVHVME